MPTGRAKESVDGRQIPRRRVGRTGIGPIGGKIHHLQNGYPLGVEECRDLVIIAPRDLARYGFDAAPSQTLAHPGDAGPAHHLGGPGPEFGTDTPSQRRIDADAPLLVQRLVAAVHHDANRRHRYACRVGTLEFIIAWLERRQTNDAGLVPIGNRSGGNTFILPVHHLPSYLALRLFDADRDRLTGREQVSRAVCHQEGRRKGRSCRNDRKQRERGKFEQRRRACDSVVYRLILIDDVAPKSKGVKRGAKFFGTVPKPALYQRHG